MSNTHLLQIPGDSTWVTVTRLLVALGLLTAGSRTDSVAQTTPANQPLVYKDKTAAQWMEELLAARNEISRAKAAEALGFIARSGRMTYGGFSDVPIDSPEPTKLSEEALKPIVEALLGGLTDSKGRVRASSAIALFWIGPRAKAAVPKLIRLLNDDDAEARKNALAAIGHMGADAREAIPTLQSMITRGDIYQRIRVAEALRLTGADALSYVPALSDLLEQDGRSVPYHHVAMELAQAGDPAIPALKKALQSSNSMTRKYAAYAISNMASAEKLTLDKESVVDALLALTVDSDAKVIWQATQAIGSIHALADRSVPALVRMLKHSDAGVVDQAVESLEKFGADARAALPALIETLRDETDDHRSTDHAIRQIGLDRASAEAISKLQLKGQSSWLLVPMCEYPDLAIEFLKANPKAIDVPYVDHQGLIRLMRDSAPKSKALQDALCGSEFLPVELIAQLGDPRFLPLIERKLKGADSYESIKLNACARACGAKPTRVVEISASKPGDFKPKSAWPGSVPSRMVKGSFGHGDGYAVVIVTGQILREDGSAVSTPKFYRVNDSMLLGQGIRQEEPITFDAKTGRFLFMTHVFAAYSMGEGKREPGPYQTGSSMVLIEAEGCKPLQVRFYDEMPEVRITMSAREADGAK